MSYKKELIRKVKDPRLWPDFKRADFLSELDGIAEDAFLYDTVYGYLSSVLIYHQLVEEIIERILENVRFFIQLSIFPMQINFPEQKNRMFGVLLKELESTVEFDEKEAILQKAQEINTIRIQLVHKLTKQTTLDDVKNQARKVKDLFYEVFTLSQETIDHFYAIFSDFKDTEWDDLLDEE